MGDIHVSKLGILATIIVVVSASAAELISYGLLGETVAVLDPGSNDGVFGAAVDTALTAAAVSAWVLSARSGAARSGAARPVAAVLAGLLTFLTADQVTGLHNHVRHWLVFYLPVLIAAFGCLVAVARELSVGSRSRLIGSGLLLLSLSFFLHVFGPRLPLGLGPADTTGWGYQIKAVGKHGTESAGWFLIALGLFGPGFPEPRGT